MSERAARSRELVAAGYRPAVVARVAVIGVLVLALVDHFGPGFVL